MAFRWVYIGSGHIAEKTAANVTKGEHEIVAVYGRNKETAAALAEKYGAAVYDTAKEAILHPGADAVYIGTPHTSHVEYACLAMELGRPVLCEKPVGVTVADVDTLTACAEKNGVYFAEAMWTWFCQPAQTVKQWIQSGEIGDVKCATLYYYFPGLLKPRTSRVRKPETAGGSLLDVGIYPITYCYNLFGVPQKIICDGTVKDGIDIEEHIELRYRGFTCYIHSGLNNLRESCLIEGAKGTVSLPLFHAASSATLKNENGKRVFRGETNYLPQFDRAAADIRQGKKQSDCVPWEATRQCMKIMDECRRQMGLRYPFEEENT